MSTLAVLHLVAIAVWVGVLLGEAVLETLAARSPDQEQVLAALHFRIDLFVEIPMLVAVLVTGILLLGQASWSVLLGVKIAGGLLVIGGNVACVPVVIRRHLAVAGATGADAEASFAVETRRIQQYFIVFTPIGLAVLILGFALS